MTPVALPTPKRARLVAADALLGAAIRAAGSLVAKAALPAGIAERDRQVAPFEADLAEYFGSVAAAVLGRIRKVEAFNLDPDDVDWTVLDEELERVLIRWYTNLGGTAFAAVSEQLGVEVRFDLNSRGVRRVLGRVATRVTQISERSRDLIRGLVADSIERGWGADDLAGALQDMFDGWSTSRAHAVALTETANAYNEAAVAGYEDSGLVDEVEVFDGPDCGWTDHDDPDLADGSLRTLDEARDYPIAHPHCQRAFGPVVAR